MLRRSCGKYSAVTELNSLPDSTLQGCRWVRCMVGRPSACEFSAWGTFSLWREHFPLFRGNNLPFHCALIPSEPKVWHLCVSVFEKAISIINSWKLCSELVACLHSSLCSLGVNNSPSSCYSNIQPAFWFYQWTGSFALTLNCPAQVLTELHTQRANRHTRTKQRQTF